MAKFMGMEHNTPKVQKAIETAICELKGVGPSREYSMVKTKLHEALLWLKAAERGDGFSIYEDEAPLV